jgi:hypothetical protein
VPVAVLFLREHIGAREWAAIGTAMLSVLALSRETPPIESQILNPRT